MKAAGVGELNLSQTFTSVVSLTAIVLHDTKTKISTVPKLVNHIICLVLNNITKLFKTVILLPQRS